jgi:uncharacterized protein DUF3800
VNAPFAHPERNRAPLLGQNLVRLLYLDEAGTDFKVSHLCVAGVLVHGDLQYLKIDQMFDGLSSMYIPPRDRILGFEFHASDIYHGSGYFDRRKPEWAEARRMALLGDLATVIDALELPVVVGYYEKKKFGAGVLPPNMSRKDREEFIHNSATVDCLVRIDRWLERFAPAEVAAVVHEDHPRSKKAIKNIVRALRNGEILDAANAEDLRQFGLPLRRIIDTVHFASKPEARPLQLADLCAFSFGRMAKGMSIPKSVESVMAKHSAWLRKDNFGLIQRVLP